jgi:hypothetical protein
VVTRLNTAIQALGIADVAGFSLESPGIRKFGVPRYSLSALIWREVRSEI